MVISEDTYTLLGKASVSAQRVEFILYGIASHLGHLEEAKKDNIFNKIKAKDFLSDDPEKRKLRTATLGRIYKVFGEKLLISGLPFDHLIKERNFFAHECFRELCKVKNEGEIRKRLNEFLELADVIEKALKGLLSQLMEAFAKKEGRESEFRPLSDDEVNRSYYKAIVALHMHKKGEITLPDIASVRVIARA